MSDYEIRRAEKIARNQTLLRDLGLSEKANYATKALPKDGKPPVKKRRTETGAVSVPTRTSARIAAVSSTPTYNEEDNERAGKTRKLARASKNAPNTSDKKATPRSNNDSSYTSTGYHNGQMERLMIEWVFSENDEVWYPDRLEDGTFEFDDYPDFTPNKSPEEILREGAFGGSYFRPLQSKVLGIRIQDDWKELPAEWTTGLDIAKYLTSPTYNPEINKYKVACGQSIEEWEAAGWIRHEHDVRGWFQWYTRFYRGRRCEDDERQISRWKKCVGKTGRWRRTLLKKYVQMGIRSVADEGDEEGEEEVREVSPVVHQTCHHWAWEVRQDALDEFWATST